MSVLDDSDVRRRESGIDLPSRNQRREIVGPEPVDHQLPSGYAASGGETAIRRVKADVDRALRVAGESAPAVAHRDRHFRREHDRRTAEEVLARRARLLSVRTVRKLNPRSPGRSSGESGVSRISRIVCALP